ncbi:oligosaccharide flippase family protein [Patescibacteria group bacterium]|nr:oligosaccharide flippase family protein [Patescibacteria group bacterium]
MKKVIRKIPGFYLFERVFATVTFRQSTITFIGTFVNGLLGAVFYILVARFLGPANFGLLSVSIAALTLVADIGDLGTDTGLVNFVSKYIKKKPKKAKRFLKLGLKIKLAVSILVLVFGFFLAPYFAQIVFAKPDLVLPLKIASFGVGTFLLFSFVTHSLQASQKFWSWSLIQVGSNALRVILVFLLFYFGLVGIESTLLVYSIIPLVGFFAGIVILKPDLLKVKNEFSVAKEFFKYNKWVATFTLLAAISSRLDTFISARLLTASDVGIYSAANQVVMIVPQIVTAVGTVIAPKMAEMGRVSEFVKYLKKSQLMVAGIAVLGLFSIPLVSYLIPILFGVEYVASIPLFIVLLFAMLVFLISVPIHMSVFYYFSYPKLFFWLAIMHFAIIAGVGWNLISIYGAMGAAMTVLVGQIVNFLVPAVWVLRKIQLQKVDK